MPTAKRMKTPARQIHVRRHMSGIKTTQLQPQTVGVRGLNTCQRPSREEAFQTAMAEAPDHVRVYLMAIHSARSLPSLRTYTNAGASYLKGMRVI